MSGVSSRALLGRWWPSLLLVGVGGVLALLPQLLVTVPGVLPGPLSSPGSLQILAVALVFAGLAMSYDVLFGYAGLFSFGHALYFGIGVYGSNMLMVKAGLSYAVAVPLTVVIGATIAAVTGAVALRLRGIAFAMVTLAFLEVFTTLVLTDKFKVTGGEEGMPLAADGVPEIFRGVVNYGNVYYLALGFLIVTTLVAILVTRSEAGRVWLAIRENERRAEMIGVKIFAVKLLAFVVAGALASLGGTVYLMVVRGANPGTISIDFSLAILLMVILGGAGRLWGAAVGGVLYALLVLRLPSLSTTGAFDALPDTLAHVVSQPLFILGVIFVILVMFLPQGLAGALKPRRLSAGAVDEGR